MERVGGDENSGFVNILSFTLLNMLGFEIWIKL
jgi:hypothetical protein